MTDLEAVNKALLLINQEPISGLSEASKTARVMSALLETDKRLVLEAFCWTFAVKRSYPVPAALIDGFNLAYAVPPDALVIRAVSSSMKLLDEWRVIGDVIACNDVVTSLEYTVFVPDVSRWSAQAADALVQKLAADGAVALSGAPEMGQALLEKYYLILRNAQGSDAVNERVPLPQATHYIDVRGG